jgi:hypothetical protein
VLRKREDTRDGREVAIVQVLKGEEMKEGEMGEVCSTQWTGNADTALARKHEGTVRLRRPSGRWVDNIKIAFVILLGDIGLCV